MTQAGASRTKSKIEWLVKRMVTNAKGAWGRGMGEFELGRGSL